MFLDLGAYKNFYAKSLEEFNIEDGAGLRSIYYELKKSKTRYRLSLEQGGTEFSRCFSELKSSDRLKQEKNEIH